MEYKINKEALALANAGIDWAIKRGVYARLAVHSSGSVGLNIAIKSLDDLTAFIWENKGMPKLIQAQRDDDSWAFEGSFERIDFTLIVYKTEV